MPIYEYRCASCGCQKEFLRKVSDPALTTCPECGKETFSKMLTAAGFQLKGSGWYATDFRNNGAAPAAKPDDKSESGKDKSSDSGDKTDKSEKLPTSAKSDAPSTGSTPGSTSAGSSSSAGSTASESAAP
ncbi:MAG: FmdB family zinc ribbon protein [Burkholderiales bacterium]